MRGAGARATSLMEAMRLSQPVAPEVLAAGTLPYDLIVMNVHQYRQLLVRKRSSLTLSGVQQIKGLPPPGMQEEHVAGRVSENRNRPGCPFPAERQPVRSQFRAALRH
jgi:hypothetical protein